MQIRFLYSFLFLSILLLNSCKKGPDQNLGLDENYADFQDFYVKFHQDSTFQMQHITFPLQGIPDNVANAPDYQEGFTFQTSNWVMNKPINLEESRFKRSLRTIGAQLIVEQLVHESGSYGMERRFAKIDGEWMLIYYQGINPINRNG